MVGIILTLSTLASGLISYRTLWGLVRYKYRPSQAESSSDLPTVSVCIAARNETHALAQSLEGVLSSDYPKIEILVLDDASTDDTSHIIRSFAHSGVRFIAGKPLPAGWLGKNHAYKVLMEEASGTYILFLDVDTKLRVSTISQLVTELQTKQKKMLSVLPQRLDSYRASALFGTMRYYWSLLLASKLTPPSASSLWMIERSLLLELEKGLSTYGASVRPEAHIARQVQAMKQYYYLIGTQELGVSVEKRLSSQYETATRLYYPIAGHQALRAVAAMSILVFLLIPVVLILNYDASIHSLWAMGIIFVNFMVFAYYTHRTMAFTGARIRSLLWIFLILQELMLLIHSCFRYATKSVYWKGRSVHSQPSNQSHLTLDS